MAKSKTPEERLADLEKKFFEGLVDRHPLLAVRLGFFDYADQLPDGSRKAIEGDIEYLQKFKKEFSPFKGEKNLPPSRKVDLELARHFIEQTLFELEELRLWETVPDMGTLTGLSIWQVYKAEHMAMKERCQLIIKMLDDITGFSERCQTRLKEPPQLWIDMELATTSRSSFASRSTSTWSMLAVPCVFTSM